MTTRYYYVNSFSNRLTGWTKYGVSPYLGAIDANQVGTGIHNQTTGDYGFQNPGAETSEIIDGVSIEVYGSSGDAAVPVYLSVNGGASWTLVGTIEEVYAAQWNSFDVSALVTDWTKVTDAIMYLWYVEFFGETGPGLVDCARIKVVSHIVAAIASKRLLVGVGL